MPLKQKFQHCWRRLHHCSKLDPPASHPASIDPTTTLSTSPPDSNSGNSPLHESAKQTSCRVCLDFDKSALKERFDENGRTPTSTVSELQSSADDGCASCQVLRQGLTTLIGHPSLKGTIALEAEYAAGTNENSSLILTYALGNNTGNFQNIEFSMEDGTPPPQPSIMTEDAPSSEEPSLGEMKLASVWLQNCQKKHDQCMNKPSTLPRRVIDVGSTGEEPKLYISSGEKAHYAALSHCWGNKEAILRTIRSTISTVNLRRRSIPMKHLPRTFCDAVSITRQLGLKYLWIDSLCILQDCEDDWHAHSASMCDIYKGATVTISADSAANCHDGIFGSMINARKNDKQVVIYPPTGNRDPIYVRRTSLSIFKFENEDGSPGQRFMHYAADTDPLFRRAWSLQEWILSRRVLRFGSGELTWECEQEVWCECHPGRSQPCFPPHLHEPQREKQIAERTRYDNRRKLLDNWFALVEHYTGRELTLEQDRLPALAGLAAEAVPYAYETYLCGHWKEHCFPESLLWTSKRTGSGTRNPHVRHTTGYYAPTWSWASINGQVSTSSGSIIRPEFRVLEMRGHPATSNLFGPLKPGAYIQAAGLTLELQVRKHEDPQSGLFDGDAYKTEQARGTLACPPCKNQDQAFEVNLMVDVDAPRLEIGPGDILTFLLIAEKTGIVLKKRRGEALKSGPAYERVAVFEIANDEDRRRWEAAAVRRPVTIV